MLELAAQALAANSEATDIDVLAYMTARAAANPTLFKLVEFVTLIELLLTVRDTESEGDFDTYMQVNKLAASILLPVTNAHRYVRMVFDRVMRWTTGSPADMCIFRNFTFTGLSRAGVKRFKDRLHEWVQNQIRNTVHHTYKPSQDVLIRRRIENVDLVAKVRSRGSDISGVAPAARERSSMLYWHRRRREQSEGKPPPDRWAGWANSVAFRGAQLVMLELELAGGYDPLGAPIGDPRAPPKTYTRARQTRVLAASELVDLRTGLALDAGMLATPFLAPARARSYAEQFLVGPQEKPPLRRAAESTMFARPVQAAARTQELKDRAFRRATCSDAATMGAEKSDGKRQFITKEELWAAIAALTAAPSRAGEGVLPPPPPSGANKPQLIGHLCALRCARSRLLPTREAFDREVSTEGQAAVAAWGGEPAECAVRVTPPGGGAPAKEYHPLREGWVASVLRGVA
jgi:hypothetical protein